MTGRKSAHTSSKTLKIHKVFPAAFSSSGRLSASAKLLAPDSDGFSSDFWLLRRRCVVTPRNQIKAQQSGFDLKRKKERAKCSFRRKAETKWRKFLLTMRKARPTSRTPSKAQRSGFARKKEEGASIVQFSPQGGNGMVRTSLLPRPPSKAQRSGFARKKEEGESIMEFSPQGGNGMARTSSDAGRRMCSCLPRVIRFIIYSAAARNNSQHNYQRRGGVEWQSLAEVKN